MSCSFPPSEGVAKSKTRDLRFSSSGSPPSNLKQIFQTNYNMGVVCSAIASVFAAIGRALTGLFSLIAGFLSAIVNVSVQNSLLYLDNLKLTFPFHDHLLTYPSPSPSSPPCSAFAPSPLQTSNRPSPPSLSASSAASDPSSAARDQEEVVGGEEGGLSKESTSASALSLHTLDHHDTRHRHPTCSYSLFAMYIPIPSS